MAPSVDAVLGDKDLLKSIFDQLDLREICNAAATCLLWYQVANHDDFWKQIDFRGKRVLPENAAALLRRHPKVEELDLSGLDGSQVLRRSQPPQLSIQGFVLQVAPHLTNLRKLTFSARSPHMDSVGPLCPIANHLVAQLSSFSSLTCLSLSGMSIVNGSGVHGDLAHSGLKRLVLDNTESSGVTVRCPELTFLSMAGAANTRMPNLDEAPALQALDLSRCSKLAEGTTRAALIRLTALRQLNISGISNFLDQTIQQLATSLEQLTWLDMSRVTAVSFQGVRGFTALQHLDISRCDSLNTGAVTTALESFECLQSLVLDGCNLQSLKLSMPKLKDLSIRGCHALAELEVRAWQLSRLDLGPWDASGQANYSLAKLTLTSGGLRSMEWNKLNKLSTVDLDCPALAELTVRDCNFPDASVLQSLGDTAHAPTLKSDVFDSARKAALLATKPFLSTTSSFGMGLTRSLGEAAEQGGMGWLALGGDEDFEMEDLDLEEGPDPPLPGQEDDDEEDNVNDDDDDSDGGDGSGRGFAGARGGRGYGRRGRARPTASWVVRRHSEDRPRQDEGWQGPDRLPRELVRFGAAGRQGNGAGGSSSAAGASSQQPVYGHAGASSSAAAAAAGAAASVGDAGAGPSSSSAPLGAGSSQGAAAAQEAPTAAAAGDASGAGGSQRARPGSVSDTLGAGIDWLWSGVSSSRGLLAERRFIWGSSGDRLQQVAPSPSQQAAASTPTPSQQAGSGLASRGARGAAAPAAPAAAAAGDGPDLGRAREDEDASDFSKRKAQRLEGTGAQRLTRASAAAAAAAAAAGPSRSPRQPPPQPPALRQQRQQQQRRRQRWGGAVRLTRQEPGGRWQVRDEAGGARPSNPLAASSLAAAAAAGADDVEDWLEDYEPTEDLDEPSAVMSLGPAIMTSGPAIMSSGGCQPSSRQDWAGNSQPFCRRMRRRGGNGGSDDEDGDDDDDGSSSESDAGAGAGVGGGAAAADGDRVAAAKPRRSSIVPGKGGVPRLRVLHVEGCERLQELQLSHLGLEQVVVAGCNSLVVVALHAPRLTALELQELGELKGACLQEVSVPGITMGSCSSLQGIELSSKITVRLDVRGCGGLQQLHLDCPALQVLDANFCGSLSDEGLAAAVANLPPLRQLALSVCCQVGSSGLSSLSQLTTLQELDLSYTEVSTLQPILDSCPALQSLSIASCRSLGRDALLPLLDNQQQALSQLTSLDASYCDVQDQLVAQLLLRCSKLRHLALSGCAGVTDAIWQQVEEVQMQQVQQRAAGAAAAAAGGGVGSAGVCGVQCAAGGVAAVGAALMDLDGDDSQAAAEASWGPGSLGDSPAKAAGSGDGSGSSSLLESLSLVRCSNLRSLCLGLLPASGRVELLSAKQYLLSGGRAALQEAAPAAAHGSWVEVPSAVSQLTSLKLGLSGVQVVALALPRLAHLDLSSCKHLRVLELRCPLLLQLQLQACRALPVVSAVKGVLGAPHLQMLDVQHMLPPQEGSSHQGPGVSGGDARHSSDDSAGAEEAGSSGVAGMIEVDCSSAAVTRSRGSLLAAVAATGDLPPDAAGQGTDAQVLNEMLHEVAATHGSLKAGGILRCTSVCKVCSRLAQCSL